MYQYSTSSLICFHCVTAAVFRARTVSQSHVRLELEDKQIHHKSVPMTSPAYLYPLTVLIATLRPSWMRRMRVTSEVPPAHCTFTPSPGKAGSNKSQVITFCSGSHLTDSLLMDSLLPATWATSAPPELQAPTLQPLITAASSSGRIWRRDLSGGRRGRQLVVLVFSCEGNSRNSRPWVLSQSVSHTFQFHPWHHKDYKSLHCTL